MTHCHVVRLVNTGQTRVSGIFHGNGPAPAQQLQDQLVEHLGTGTHHYLVRVGRHAPKALQVVGDRGPELDGPLGAGRIDQARLAFAAEDLPHGLRP